MKKIDVKKSCYPDKESNWKMKECRHKLANKINRLITKSLDEGTILEKEQILFLFRKGGNCEYPSNYRLVPNHHSNKDI